MQEFGSIEILGLAVALAGVLQVLLGVFRLGGFTHMIPSAVIKGMLAAIGIILISKQIPLLIGYDKPDFWRKELFNVFTFHHGFAQVKNLAASISTGPILVAVFSLLLLVIWTRTMRKRFAFLPTSFITVLAGVALAWIFKHWIPGLQLQPNQFVNVPDNVLQQISLPNLIPYLPHLLFGNMPLSFAW
ncbi:MAG: SulP family inorganic anion transporter [Lewinellaceae bacterium]|nr:SulP family inorganic anion transporter [Lewinellaceae bacterium]